MAGIYIYLYTVAFLPSANRETALGKEDEVKLGEWVRLGKAPDMRGSEIFFYDFWINY